jgi:hypothetical protein
MADEVMWNIRRQYKNTNPKLEDFIKDMEMEGWNYDDTYSDDKELYFVGSFLNNADCDIFVKVSIKKHGNKIEILGHEFES